MASEVEFQNAYTYREVAAIKKLLEDLPIEKAKDLAHEFHKIVSQRLYQEAIKHIGPKLS